MATAPVTKYQVMAKCIQIMTNQMRDSRHPEMKRRLREKIDYFSSFGVIDNYKMIVYSNSIVLVHSDYRHNPNMTLFDGGKLYIGAFDDMLALNDVQCIRIHGNGKADSGACVHGYVEGDCITESLEREKGKEVKYQYEANNPYAALNSYGKRAKNNMSLPFFRRIFQNETIGQGDFIKCLLCVVIISAILNSANLDLLLIPLGLLLVYITYKRIKDAGYRGGTAILLLLLCYMLSVFGFILLSLISTKVSSTDEVTKAQEMMSKEIALAEKALKTRCDVFNGSIGWLLINADTMRIAASLTADKQAFAGVPSGSSSNSQDYPEDDEAECEREEAERREEEERQREEEAERREEAERQSRISGLQREISHLESRISSLQGVVSRAESQASSRRQQGETYLSYANSTEDDNLRNDYLQSADSCFSEALQYESEASSAESEISSLQSEVDSLQSEINSLY